MMVWKWYTFSRSHASKFELWSFPQANDMWFNTLSWFQAIAMNHSSQSAMRLYTYNNYVPTQPYFVSLSIQCSANCKTFNTLLGFPRWCSGKESANHCRRLKRRRFSPWVWKIPWSKKWQSTPLFLPGKFHGQGRLVKYSLWDCKQSDTNEHTHITLYYKIGYVLDNFVPLRLMQVFW